MRLGRFTSITEVYNWIEQFFNEYNTDITQVLQTLQTYETNLEEITLILKQSVSLEEAFVPDRHTEVTCLDGSVIRTGSSGSWAALRDGAGNQASASGLTFAVTIASYTVLNTWMNLLRIILLFDTHTLPSNAYITQAVLRVYCAGKTDIATWATSLCVTGATPASDIDLVNADYGRVSDIVLSNRISTPAIYASQFVEFTLNPDGIAAIDKDGITRFALREATYDVANVAPPWISNQSFTIAFNAADSTTYLDRRPLLFVSYILPP